MSKVSSLLILIATVALAGPAHAGCSFYAYSHILAVETPAQLEALKDQAVDEARQKCRDNKALVKLFADREVTVFLAPHKDEYVPGAVMARVACLLNPGQPRRADCIKAR